LSGGGRDDTAFSDAHGVEIAGNGATGNTVLGNIIGLDIGEAESGPLCNANLGFSLGKGADDDSDGVINDGCPAVGGAESGPQCSNSSDDDGDGVINDGCPQVGATAESGAQCLNSANDDSGDDSLVNDGCPSVQVASGNQLQGNLIGTTSPGTSLPPPGSTRQAIGVLIDGAPGNQVGVAGGFVNVVSGNITGIQVQGLGAISNVVQRSYVGTNITGSGDLGNLASG